MADELTELPECIAAGTTVRYRRSIADYLASAGWTLKLHLAGKSVLHITGTADVHDHIVTIKPSDWDAAGVVEPGLYQMVEQVEKGSGATLERHTVGAGFRTVTPNLTTATAGQLQSWKEKIVDILQQYLSGRLPAGLLKYTVAGRQIEKYSPTEAADLLRQYEADLVIERDPGPFAGQILAVFKPAGSNQ